MITAKEFPNKTFATKQELFTALRENKQEIYALKKAETKYADAVSFVVPVMNDKGESVKAETIDLSTVNSIQAKLVINTTGLLDSHSDVHIKGLWKKSVRENKNILLLQEHVMKFDHVITDKNKAYIQTYTWKELGFKFDGDTEALVFDSIIDKDRNPYMFDQYGKGYVKEHSVGMRYVNYELAINSESKFDEEEKAVWDKYIDQVANRDVAEAQGYFWAVLEAKVVEGSAVVKGSNYATPTLEIEEAKADNIQENSEPSTSDTPKVEPLKSTPQQANQLFKFYQNL